MLLGVVFPGFCIWGRTEIEALVFVYIIFMLFYFIASARDVTEFFLEKDVYYRNVFGD